MCLIILPAAAAFAIVAAHNVRVRECTIALLVVCPLVYRPVAYYYTITYKY